MNLRRFPALWIFASALLIRLAWIATLGPQLSWIDEHDFVQIARHLSNGDGYIASSFRANPVLPAYLSAVFSIFGESYLIARIGQGLFGALTCVLVYRTGALLFGPAVGITAGVLLAIYPPHVFLTGFFYVVCLFSFFISLTVYLAVLTLGSRRPVLFAALTGLACGVSALTRSVFIAYVPFLAAAWIYAGWPAWRRQALAGLVMMVMAAATILPWTVRNYAVYGDMVPISSGLYTHLWQGNNLLSDGGPDDRFLTWDSRYPFWTQRLARLSDAERARMEATYAEVDRRTREMRRRGEDRYVVTDRILKPIVLEWIRTHPERAASLFVRKVGTFFSAFTRTETENEYTTTSMKLAASLFFYPMMTLALVGFWLHRRDRRLAIIHALIISITLAYAMLTPCTRYRLPVDSYLLLLASVTLVQLWPAGVERRAPRRRRSVAAIGRILLDRGHHGAIDLLCGTGEVAFSLRRRRRRRELRRGANPEKLLVFHEAAGVGNLVLLTGLLSNLRQMFPATHICLALPKSAVTREVLPPDLYDEIVDFEFPAGRRRLLAFAWRELRSRRFDLALATFFSPTVLTSCVLMLAGCRYRIAFAQSRHRGFLNTITLVDDGGHELDRHLRLLAFAGVEIRRQVSVRTEAPETVRAGARAARLRRSGPGPLLGVHPGCDRANAAKRWPIDRFIAVIRRLIHEHGASAAVFLGPDEDELEPVVRRALGEAFEIVSNEPLHGAAALISHCDLFLANDTGLMHVAAALGVPTVAVFGPTDAEKNAPMGPHVLLTAESVSCSPCYAGPPLTCGHERRHCLEEIGVDAVVESLRRLYADGTGKADGGREECASPRELRQACGSGS